jgi:hypothetical protein
MAAGSRTSFQKRQKEIARMEKQREKAAKRLERKRLAATRGPEDATPEDTGIALNPADDPTAPPESPEV